MARYDDLAAFAAVVRAGSFTRAAAQLGMTQSGLNQAVRGLKKRLDFKLLNRTTRSISTTEAGEQLYRTVESRLADIDAELALLAEKRGKPAGAIRITATEHAVRSLIWPRLLPWLPEYPDIHIEISADNRFTDIVADRFDIGVRLGGDVARDMIAVRIAPDMIQHERAHVGRCRGGTRLGVDTAGPRRETPGRRIARGHARSFCDHLSRLPRVLRDAASFARADTGRGGLAAPSRLNGRSAFEPSAISSHGFETW